MTKGSAFGFCLASIMVIFAAMFVIGVVKANLEVIPVAACLTALCTITGGYLGIKIADNGIKGKCWNQQMFDSTHKLEEEEK